MPAGTEIVIVSFLKSIHDSRGHGCRGCVWCTAGLDGANGPNGVRQRICTLGFEAGVVALLAISGNTQDEGCDFLPFTTLSLERNEDITVYSPGIINSRYQPLEDDIRRIATANATTLLLTGKGFQLACMTVLLSLRQMAG